jgi:hypothetical protein
MEKVLSSSVVGHSLLTDGGLRAKTGTAAAESLSPRSKCPMVAQH